MWPETTIELVMWTMIGAFGLLVTASMYEEPGTMKGLRALAAAACGAFGFTATMVASHVGLTDMWPNGLLVLFITCLPAWGVLIAKGKQGGVVLVLGVTWLCALAIYIAIVT